MTKPINIPENTVPSIQSIIEEYEKQGKKLTQTEAERIREQIKNDIASGCLDARNDYSDDTLSKVNGGVGGAPIPTLGVDTSKKNYTSLDYKHR